MKSVYIHIPFCKNICSYCDFCKFYYKEDWVHKYLDSLYKEIEARYQRDEIKTIYIGGGTPSTLSYPQLDRLFECVDILDKSKLKEFTFECNIEDINESLLNYLHRQGVTRLSIGVQTFNKELLKVLGRIYSENSIDKIKLAKKYFNVNVDLIYAIPGQTLDNLNSDLDILLSLDIDHISTYSLIIEEHTKLYIDKISNIDEELDYQMYQLICRRLSNYHHYEISNFAKEGCESIHNLTYWNNDEYYGFGLSSSGYINNIRYDNTKNLNKYLKGEYIYHKEKIDLKKKIENEFILGLRKIVGINKQNFYDNYHVNIKKIGIVQELLEKNKLEEDNNNIFIPSHLLYTSNDILINFIDLIDTNIV